MQPRVARRLSSPVRLSPFFLLFQRLMNLIINNPLNNSTRPPRQLRGPKGADACEVVASLHAPRVGLFPFSPVHLVLTLVLSLHPTGPHSKNTAALRDTAIAAFRPCAFIVRRWPNPPPPPRPRACRGIAANFNQAHHPELSLAASRLDAGRGGILSTRVPPSLNLQTKVLDSSPPRRR
jgi:hypothetical protein